VCFFRQLLIEDPVIDFDFMANSSLWIIAKITIASTEHLQFLQTDPTTSATTSISDHPPLKPNAEPSNFIQE
jgi:hypothetical protein